MKERIIISVGNDWDGFTFRLRPKSRESLKSQVRSPKFAPLLDQVSISFDEKKKLESVGGPVYMYVVEMLTGMSVEEINKIGGIVFMDEADKIVHDTTKKGEDA